MSSVKSCFNENVVMLLGSTDSKKLHFCVNLPPEKNHRKEAVCLLWAQKEKQKKKEGSFVTILWHVMTRTKQCSHYPVYGKKLGKVVKGKEVLCLLLNTKLAMWLRGLITFLITVFMYIPKHSPRVIWKNSFWFGSSFDYIYTDTYACICMCK